MYADRTGTCEYCLTENISLIEPRQLTEYFELLVSGYHADAQGKLLVQWFREDWGLFRHSRLDDSRAKDLLAEILNDGEIVRQSFLPTLTSGGNWLEVWDNLCEELLTRNRFFPKISIDYERLSALLTVLQSDPAEIGQTWFRARIRDKNLPYLISEMGAPPRERATYGRANPAGIPYLYLASSVETAMSETRPHTGAAVCIADFNLDRPLKVIDLRTPKGTVSPFLLGDAEAVRRMRSDLPFLEHLGQELARPVLPHAAAIEYTPSQFLCEFIKGENYDGVLYKSSVGSGSGVNLALFDTAAASCQTVRMFQVTKVVVEAIESVPTL